MKNYKLFTESIRDKMTPKSTEDILKNIKDIDNSKMENTKNESNVLYTMLGTVHLLDDEKLTVAFHILFDKDWKKYWTEQDKAREMRSIFNGGTQPCRPFENWVKCIEYLSLHCA